MLKKRACLAQNTPKNCEQKIIARCLDAWMLGLCLVTSFVVADAGYLLWRDGAQSASSIFGGLAMAWWAALVALLPLLAVTGLLFSIAGRSKMRSPVAWVTSLLADSPASDARRSATVMASLFSFAALIGMTVPVVMELNRRIVRDHFTAIAIGLAVGMLCLLLFLGFGLVTRVFDSVIAKIENVPLLGWPFQNATRLVSTLFFVVVVAVAIVVNLMWKDVFSHAPWPDILRMIFGLSVAVMLYQLWRMRRSGSAFRFWATAASTVAFVGIAPFAANLSADAWQLKRVAFSDSIPGGMGRALFRKVLDTDHDGMISLLGDGDCDPSSKKVYYGAVDIPDNGIDEDCDGDDLTATGFEVFGRWNHELPESFPEKPNVVLVTVDAFAANRIGRKRNGKSITPNLDRLIEHSVYFKNVFSQGPSTRLSFPAMFTSKWDSTIERKKGRGKHPFPLGKSEKQIQDLMHSAGYETISLISHIGFVPGRWPTMTRGFDRIDRTAVGKAKGTHNARELTDAALRIWNERRKKPVYMWVHYFDPHFPYSQPDGADKFGEKVEDLYDAEIQFTDRHMAPLLNELEQDPNTILIFSADHGTVFHPRPETRKKRYGYDVYTATLNVPLIVHAPGIKPRRADDVVTTLDILPTIANLVRLKTRKKFSGDSLVPLLFGNGAGSDRLTYHQFYLPEKPFRKKKSGLRTVGVRDDRFNLVMNRQDGSFELYDWVNDYYEINNIAHEAKYADDYKRLRQKLLTYVHLVGPFDGTGYRRFR